jgi:hypothetical protein
VVEALTVYELWDLTRLPIPTRSRLYQLAPVGVGTPGVESLSSYIARLAEAHGVHTRTLVMRELLPLLGRAHLSKPVDSSLSSFWWQGTRALNGTRALARDWVQVLERLTLRDDLRFLTWLSWAEVLTPSGRPRATRAWCPACYAQWQSAGPGVYEPLLWTLQVVEVCPIHHRRLQQRCPHADCRQRQPWLAPHTRLGYCVRCERWLGLSADSEPPESESFTADEWQWQVWVVEAVGELLAAAPRLPTAPRPERIAVAINTYIQQSAEGRASVLARSLRLANCTVGSWRHGRSIPKLPLLLRICYCFGTAPLRLLTEDGIVADGTRRRPWAPEASAASHRAHHRRFDVEGLRQTLETVLASSEQPPPSMREVARRLGYAHSQLQACFPELCHAISERYLTYQRVRGAQRMQQQCDEVRQAAMRIHAQGLYPSASRIALQLSVPGIIRHPTAMAA